MTNILLVDGDDLINMEFKKEFEKNKNDVDFSSFDNSLTKYQESMPMVIIVNFEDPTKAAGVTEKIIAYDNDACILALSPYNENPEKDKIERSGVKAVIPTPIKIGEKDVKIITDNIYSVCSTLINEKCLGCNPPHDCKDKF